MEREDLSARGACERLADQTIDRTWLLVFDKVVAARHRPTAHALYQQFRLWLQSRGSSISELNSLRRGRHFPVQAFPPHLAAAAADIKWWLEWLIQVTPTLMGPQATGTGVSGRRPQEVPRSRVASLLAQGASEGRRWRCCGRARSTGPPT